MGDRLGSLKGERTAKNREPAKGGLIIGVEQVVAPLDRRTQCALPFRQIVRATDEQRQRGVKALQHRGRGEQLRPRRPQLQRQWQEIQPPTNPTTESSRFKRRPAAAARLTNISAAASSASGSTDNSRSRDKRSGARRSRAPRCHQPTTQRQPPQRRGGVRGCRARAAPASTQATQGRCRRVATRLPPPPSPRGRKVA